MKYIPKTGNTLILRTDFSNYEEWKALCKAIREPVGDFMAYVDFVSDPSFNGISVKQLLSLIPAGYNHSFVFMVDQIALSNPENPVLVVDLLTEPGRTFRVALSEMWSIENNLSIANMDFAEFADNTDHDGIFRGFQKI